MLSAILNSRRELSPDFNKRITMAVDLLEEAENEARGGRASGCRQGRGRDGPTA